MELLAKSSPLYQSFSTAKQRSSLFHAYLIECVDDGFLRPFLKALAEIFWEEDRLKKRVRNETLSDLFILPKESGKFLVSDAELILEESAVKPVESNQKIFLVEDLAKATPASQNKLLKIIEEPPENVYFLLGTSNVQAVLPTIRSRCKKMEIPPFEVGQVTDYFRRNNLFLSDSTLIETGLKVTGGKLIALEKLVKDGDLQNLINDTFSLLLADPKTLVKEVKGATEKKYKGYFFPAFSAVLSDAILWKNGVEIHSVFQRDTRLHRFAKRYDTSALFKAKELVLSSEKELFFNTPFALCLQTFLMKILENQKID